MKRISNLILFFAVLGFAATLANAGTDERSKANANVTVSGTIVALDDACPADCPCGCQETSEEVTLPNGMQLTPLIYYKGGDELFQFQYVATAATSNLRGRDPGLLPSRQRVYLPPSAVPVNWLRPAVLRIVYV